MSLSISGLKSAMMSATLNKTSASSALTALGNAIADYIVANAEIAFSWNGIYDGSPDPVTSTTGEITSCTITLTASGKDNQSEAITYLENEIVAGVTAAMFTVTASGFSVSSLALGITGLSLDISGSNRDNAFNDFAEQIIDWITSYVNATPLLGSHGTYVAPPGTGAVMQSIS